jgi:hypothetical protein
MHRTVNKKLIGAGVSALAVLLLLCVCVWLLMGNSFSWLSSNRRAGATGVQVHMIGEKLAVSVASADAVTLQSGELTLIDPATPLDFLDSALIPGDVVALTFHIENIGDEPVCVSEVGFLAPTDAQESARVLDGVSYYFGTQLEVALVGVDGSPVATPTWQPLLELEGDEPQRRALTLYDEGAWIAVGEAVTLTVAVCFVNAPTDQNAYRAFGADPAATEACARALYVYAHA